MITVFIADVHPLIRKTLKEILERESDMLVADEADESRAVMDKLENRLPDVLITGLSIRGESAIAMIADVKRRYPRFPILVLTMRPEDHFASQTLKAGASGYLTKDVPPDEIIRAVRMVVKGEKYISFSLAEKLETESYKSIAQKLLEPLTEKEKQIMNALATGKSVTEIARDLSISTYSVNRYKKVILKKLDIKL